MIRFTVLLDPAESQKLIDYLGQNLGVRYTVVRNGNGSLLFEAEIELNNGGDEKIASTDWELFLCHIRLIEPATIRPNGAELGTSGFKAFHLNGCLHKIVPSVGFTELLPGQTVTIAFQAQYWQVAITDVMPNWYVVTSGATPAVIKSTAGESMDFVAPFTTPEQLKRVPGDRFKPFTAEHRFDLNSNVKK
ncbi:MAG: carbohydate-binding domain-containing protein, partial [Chromatiales bacterium]